LALPVRCLGHFPKTLTIGISELADMLFSRAKKMG
jgi:hypothetical protein